MILELHEQEFRLVQLVHLEHDVVGNLGLGQQNIHVARHASGNRVDAKADLDTTRPQFSCDVMHRILCLRHRHAISRSDDD